MKIGEWREHLNHLNLQSHAVLQITRSIHPSQETCDVGRTRLSGIYTVQYFIEHLCMDTTFMGLDAISSICPKMYMSIGMKV